MTPATQQLLEELAAVECPECGGNGLVPDGDPTNGPAPCGECEAPNATGHVTPTGRRFHRLTEACDYCKGEKQIPLGAFDYDCRKCHGTSRVLASADLLERVLESLDSTPGMRMAQIPIGYVPGMNLHKADPLTQMVRELSAAWQRETAGAEA